MANYISDLSVAGIPGAAAIAGPNQRKRALLNLTVRWLFAALHLLALGIGLGAVWARGRALRGTLDPAGRRRAFAADSW